jgi:hypothetical protein
MKITPEDLKASYRQMPDAELLELNPDELTDVARKVWASEMERRGLHADGQSEDDAKPDAFDEPLLSIRSCGSLDEAWSVIAALEGAGIPARVGDDAVRNASWLGVQQGQYPVAVPASRAEEARDFLNAETPDAIIVEARFEGGVFKPVEPVDLPEGTVVEVHVPSEAFGAEEG